MKIRLLCLLLAAAPAASAQNKPPAMETTPMAPQARPAPPASVTPERCAQTARDLARMRGALGSFPAPQRANIERQLVADERTYKQECLPK
jgi:hypothetical protein